MADAPTGRDPPPSYQANCAKMLFDQEDTNGNGVLDAKELEHLCRQMNLHGTKVQSILAKYDTNKNGVIDFSEFLLFYNEVLQSKHQIALEREEELAKRKDALLKKRDMKLSTRSLRGADPPKDAEGKLGDTLPEEKSA